MCPLNRCEGWHFLKKKPLGSFGSEGWQFWSRYNAHDPLSRLDDGRGVKFKSGPLPDLVP